MVSNRRPYKYKVCPGPILKVNLVQLYLCIELLINIPCFSRCISRNEAHTSLNITHVCAQEKWDTYPKTTLHPQIINTNTTKGENKVSQSDAQPPKYTTQWLSTSGSHCLNLSHKDTKFHMVTWHVPDVIFIQKPDKAVLWSLFTQILGSMIFVCP